MGYYPEIFEPTLMVKYAKNRWIICITPMIFNVVQKPGLIVYGKICLVNEGILGTAFLAILSGSGRLRHRPARV